MPDGTNIVVGRTPNWRDGYIPPASEWNAWWAMKLDASSSLVTLGPYLRLAGGTMLGRLTLNVPPLNPLDAVTKAYADAADSLLSTGKVNRAGDTMTGPLSLSFDPYQPLHVTTKQYVDAADALKVYRTGDTMTGPLTLVGDPVSGLQAATKQYVDGFVQPGAPFLPIAGGTLTGYLTLNGVPVNPLHAATKGYVDAAVTTIYTLRGGWNASTNSPVLSNGGGGGVKGDVYTVTTAGSTSLDGNATWAIGDQVQNSGGVWVRVAYSIAFGTMAFQNANAVAITGGTAVLSSATIAGETIGPSIEPDIVWSWRGTGGNMPAFLDQTGVFNVASLVAGTLSIPTLTGLTTLGATNATFTTATIAGELVSDQAMPDLIGAVAGSNGNIVSGYDILTGEFNVASLNAGIVKVAGQPLSAATPVPSDALDVRVAPFNAVGDGQSSHGYVTTSGSTLTLTNFTGTLTLAVVDANTSTLTIVGARFSGWAFQPRHVGKRLYLVAGAYTLTATVKAMASGQQVTLDNTGITITPQTSVSGSITCPAVDTSASASGKVLVVEGMGQAAWWSQAPFTKQTDTVTPYGTQTFIAAVSGFPAANQITITGSFPFNWTSVATRILWGTNDSAAVVACATVAWPTKRRIWFSGDGRTYLLPGAIGDTAGKPSYVALAAGNPQYLVNGVVWGGDNSSAYCSTTGAQRMPHRVSQASAPRYNDVPKLVHGRQSFPRCAQIPANQPINVLLDGDSLSSMDPQSQIGLVMGAGRFIAEFIKSNPGRQINFYNIGIGGSTWASMSNQFAAFNSGSGNPYKYFVIPKPIVGTVLKIAFYSNINQTGTGPVIIPDIAVLFLSACNDKISYDGLAMQGIINQIRAVVHPDGYGPTDIVMQTDHHSMMAVAYTDGPAGGTFVGGSAGAVLQEYYSMTMNRTSARNMGFPFIDYAPLQNRMAFAFDPTRRAMRQVPQRTISPTPTVPVSLAEECLDFSFWLGMSGASDDAAWQAVQQIEFQLSTNPGNRLFLRRGANGHIWMAASSWGLAVDTVVTIANGGTAITLGAAPSFTANITVQSGWPQAYCIDGSITFTAGMQNQCAIWRTGNNDGGGNGYQYQRNYIRTVLDANDVLLHEITHDFSDVTPVTPFTIGGNQFIPQDARGQPDVVIFYPDGTIFNTKVAYGSTITPTSATLVDPAPQALSGATVSLFIGRMGLKWFDTGLAASTTTNTGIFALNVIGGEVLLGYLQDTTTLIPQYSVFKTIERFGGSFNPVVYVKAAQTITLSNRWVDDDHPIQATTPAWYQRGYLAVNTDYEQGGAGGHYGSMTRAAILETVYAHQNLSVV